MNKPAADRTLRIATGAVLIMVVIATLRALTLWFQIGSDRASVIESWSAHPLELAIAVGLGLVIIPTIVRRLRGGRSWSADGASLRFRIGTLAVAVAVLGVGFGTTNYRLNPAPRLEPQLTAVFERIPEAGATSVNQIIPSAYGISGKATSRLSVRALCEQLRGRLTTTSVDDYCLAEYKADGAQVRITANSPDNPAQSEESASSADVKSVIAVSVEADYPHGF